MDKLGLTLLLHEAHLLKEYRPVAVALIVDPSGKYLFVNSAKNRSDWGMPQGGVEFGEDIVDALFREIEEELGLNLVGKANPVYLGHEDLDAELGRPDKRGWTKGKRYFFFSLRLQATVGIKPEPSEIADYIWARPRVAAVVIMNDSRREKVELIQKFISLSEQKNPPIV